MIGLPGESLIPPVFTAPVPSDDEITLTVAKLSTSPTGTGGKLIKTWVNSFLIVGKLQQLKGKTNQLPGGFDSDKSQVFITGIIYDVVEGDKLLSGSNLIGYVSSINKFSEHWELYLEFERGK